MAYIKGNFDIKFEKILTRSTSIKGVLFYFKTHHIQNEASVYVKKLKQIAMRTCI